MRLAGGGPIAYLASPTRLLIADAQDGHEHASLALPARAVALAAAPDAVLATLSDGELWVVRVNERVERHCLVADAVAALWMDSLLILQFGDGQLAGIAPDGDVHWRVGEASPARLTRLDRERVALVHEDFRLVVLDARSGARLFESAIDPHATAPAVVGDTVVVVSPGRRATGFAIATGKRRWRTEVGFGASADLLALDDAVLVATQANQLVALADDGNPRFRSPLPGRVVAAMARWQQGVVLAPHRRREIYFVDPANGSVAPVFTLTSRLGWVEGGPTVLEDRVAVFAREGNRRELLVLRPTPTSMRPSRAPDGSRGGL